MRKSGGFSLIELLIVVAIILIIAAMAIPSLMRAKMSANDAGAASTIRTLNTAQVTFATNYPTVGYASSLIALGPNAAPGTCNASGACLIDASLACPGAVAGCPKSGYRYFMVGAPPSGGGIVTDYAASAEPLMINTSGSNLYCSTADAVIRSFKNAIPTPAGSPTPFGGSGESIGNCQTITAYGPIQ